MAGSSAPPSLTLRPIGVIRTPFATSPGTPIQPVYAGGAVGRVLVAPEYEAALDDLDGCERVWLIYWLHRAGPFRPRVIPFRDDREHGLFATRSPQRPNPIGISAVRLVRREGPLVEVADIDVVDETPLLDIKPYVPAFDAYPGVRAGWFDRCAVDGRVADERFAVEPATDPDPTGRP
ncbi:MAG TPA: tRNA (N6-threonylcarbamoyladenosine(37)-N6)-methyltransferase TrmO [Polyangia bacterium]|jgi:tRNA-Thr(GGU) m(6)t(6)A37 methyltransferase TsaA